MGFTAKLNLEEIAYGATGWNAIVTTNMQKIDDAVHSNISVTAGEAISSYETVYLKSDGKFWLAQADGTKQPAMGIALEAAVTDGTFRVQRCGPLTNASWSWTVGAALYVDPSTPGALTETKPSSNAQVVAYAQSATTVYIWPEQLSSISPFPSTGVEIYDTDSSHTLSLVCGSDLTADRDLTVIPGDAARTVTLSGNPTLGDWFDQAVKAASGPTFASLAITTNITVGGTVDGVDVAALSSAVVALGADVDGFPDELKNLATAEIQQLENIGSETISAAQWGYLGELDQSLITTAHPDFEGIDLTGTYTASEIQLSLDSTFNYTSGTGIQGRGLSIDLNVNYQASADYYTRGALVQNFINPAGDYAFDNTGYDRAIDAICYVRNDAGTLAEVTGCIVSVGSYGAGAADVSCTITNLRGLYVQGRKMTSTTITNAYGLHITGMDGSNVYDVYCADAAAKNYFAGKVGVGTTSPDASFQVGATNSNGGADTSTARIATDVGADGTVVNSLHIDTNSGDWDHNRGTAIIMGFINASDKEFTSRIIHYGDEVSGYGTKIQIQSHSMTVDVWNDGITIDQTGDITLGGDVSVTGDITIANGKTLGQAAGPLLTFDDTGNNLGITGANVAIGATSTTWELAVVGTAAQIVFGATNLTTSGFTAFALGETAGSTEFYIMKCGSTHASTPDLTLFYGIGNLRLDFDNIGFETSSFGTNANKVFAIANGTAPTTQPVNQFQMWASDQAAGNCCPHIMTEGGATLKLYQETALTTQLTTITHTAPGTPDYAIQDLTNSSPYGFVTQDEGNSVLAVIANLQARVDELETKLQAIGLLA